MCSGSDYEFSMATREIVRKHGLGVAFASALGGLIALAAVTHRPDGRTGREPNWRSA
jgi:hypothetical protein